MSMPAPLKTVLDSIPQQPQRQDSTNAQLQDLRAFAVRLGLYDADDLLRAMLERKELNELYGVIHVKGIQA